MNTSANSSMELERANSVIAELKDRLKVYEGQLTVIPPVPKFQSLPSEESKGGEDTPMETSEEGPGVSRQP